MTAVQNASDQIKRPRNPTFVWRDELLKQHGLTPMEKVVGVALSQHDNGDGRGVFASIDKLAEWSGEGRSSVNRALRKLLQLGWIERVARGGRGRDGKGRASHYRLVVPDADPLLPSEQAQAVKVPNEEAWDQAEAAFNVSNQNHQSSNGEPLNGNQSSTVGYTVDQQLLVDPEVDQGLQITGNLCVLSDARPDPGRATRGAIARRAEQLPSRYRGRNSSGSEASEEVECPDFYV